MAKPSPARDKARSVQEKGVKHETKSKTDSKTESSPIPSGKAVREWNKATELIRLFVATGFLSNARPQSLLFNSEPGSGKTELLERFMVNPQLSFASDLTSRGIHQILRKAQKGAVTHIVATEFQKFLMRKAATAENMLGTLTQALEEGVRETYIGDKLEDFGGARVGLIGAITGDTLGRRRAMLREVGFVSRVTIFKWGMPDAELKLVMQKISSGDESDLEPIVVQMPDKPVEVFLHPKLSDSFQNYVWRSFREHTKLRVFNRFRALAMASAVLEGRESVKAVDVERVGEFHDYWKQMEIG